MEKYTTAEKIDKLKDDVKLQNEEKAKTIINNEAYALTEAINNLIISINKFRVNL